MALLVFPTGKTDMWGSPLGMGVPMAFEGLGTKGWVGCRSGRRSEVRRPPGHGALRVRTRGFRPNLVAKPPDFGALLPASLSVPGVWPLAQRWVLGSWLKLPKARLGPLRGPERNWPFPWGVLVIFQGLPPREVSHPLAERFLRVGGLGCCGRTWC
jgi:hypothetical protein